MVISLTALALLLWLAAWGLGAAVLLAGTLLLKLAAVVRQGLSKESKG